MSAERRVVVGVTGASGVIYAKRLIELLLKLDYEVLLVQSEAGRRVVLEELGEKNPWQSEGHPKFREFSARDYGAPYCSGTFRLHGMAIVPATMGTVGSVASGVSANGLHRAADVCLKERRPLVVVPRETPFSTIHLENLLRLAQAGAIVLPPSPAFYQKPKTLEDLVDFVVSRVLDALSIDHSLVPRWKETPDGGIA
ncbi:MAG: UbiX family flavin prenyltransferase [Planctomycetota bacterium]